MARVVVTGGTGFIGSVLVRRLVERGDEVTVAARSGAPKELLGELPVRWATAEITDRAAIRRALRGAERLFHVAGTTNLRIGADEAFRVNALGARTVLEAALTEGVGRAVHVSSIAAVGPAAPHGTVDERRLPAGRLGIPYVDSKSAGEAEALRVAARGLDLVIACPCHVLGWGDERRSSTDIVRRFLLGRVPAYVDGAINVVDVEDVAEGLLLCMERGESGERYLLGNRNYRWDRLFADLGRISGIEPPAVRMPLPVALAAAEAAARLPGRPMLTPGEIRAASLWWTCRSTRARRELGWTTRPHEDTVEATVRWYREREGDRVLSPGSRQSAGWRLAGAAGRSAGALRGLLPGGVR
jgi:dihydroflavonol-4-reductase